MINIINKELNEYKSKLKKFRVARGLTQSELADMSGVNLKSIAGYEQTPMKINKASVESVASLAECVGCNIEDLIEKK